MQRTWGNRDAPGKCNSEVQDEGKQKLTGTALRTSGPSRSTQVQAVADSAVPDPVFSLTAAEPKFWVPLLWSLLSLQKSAKERRPYSHLASALRCRDSCRANGRRLQLLLH